LPFDALFVPRALREAVSDEAWVRAMLEAERALVRALASAGVIAEAPTLELEVQADELAVDARRSGNPAEPLAARLRKLSEDAHLGATSQDIVDTAAMLVARDARVLVLAELDGLASECARLADEHRSSLMAGRTLLQQATPITFGLKAAGWLVGAVQSRGLLAQAELPAQLGGAAGTLAALGDRGLDVRSAYAQELGLADPPLPWHTMRVPVAALGAGLATSAGVCEKIALDVALLAQTEVAEVREPAEGISSTMPHKRNPVGSALARACAIRARAAAGTLTAVLAQEHERGLGGWHAEWGALSEAFAYGGAAAAWLRETLAGVEVDVVRMRANIRDEDVLSEARRLGIEAERPEDYLGAAAAFVDRALSLHRNLEHA
jgi:3-carboxy-cis,cis-muconate cycloisomerase